MKTLGITNQGQNEPLLGMNQFAVVTEQIGALLRLLAMGFRKNPKELNDGDVYHILLTINDGLTQLRGETAPLFDSRLSVVLDEKLNFAESQVRLLLERYQCDPPPCRYPLEIATLLIRAEGDLIEFFELGMGILKKSIDAR